MRVPDATYIACPRCGEPCAMTPMQKRLYHGRTLTCQRCAKPFVITEETPEPVAAPTARTWAPDQQPAALTSVPGSTDTAPTRVRKPGEGISPGRMALLIAVVAAVVSGMLYFAIAPSLHRSRETTRRATCASNLTQIGFALQLYANTNAGRYPDSLEVLVADGSVPAEFLICPSSQHTPAPGKTPAERAANVSKGSHQSYVYVGKGLTFGPVKKLLVYELLASHEGVGVNVLYSDGSVQFLPKANALSAVPQLAPGTAATQPGMFPQTAPAP